MRSGLTENAIRHRLGCGRWIPLAPGIYAVASAPSTWERQLSAAMISRPGSVAAGSSAAYLHRFTGFGEGQPVVMAGPQANARLQLGRVIRTRDFDGVGKTVVRGFRSTTVAETLWTISRDMPRQHFFGLVDAQVAMGRTELGALRQILGRVEGTRQRGLANFRRAVAAVDPTAHSMAANVLEVALYRLLSRPEIPPVSRQHPFLLDEPARVDAFIPDWALVTEADGRNWHTRQADFQRDRDRDNQLAARGILVIRFTHDDLTKRFSRCLRTLVETGHHRRAPNVV